MATIGLSGALAIVAASPGQTFNLTARSLYWSEVKGGQAVTTLSTPDLALVQWGIPALSPSAGGQQSGLGFLLHPVATLEPDEVFTLGYFQHFNQPLQLGTGADGATLNLEFTLNNDATTHDFRFAFHIDETQNQLPCNYASRQPCADRIALVSLTAISQTAAPTDPLPYRLEIIGFQDFLTQTLTEDFISQENGTRQAALLARFVARPKPTETPEPATGWLGLGGIAWITWRWRSRQAQSVEATATAQRKRDDRRQETC